MSFFAKASEDCLTRIVRTSVCYTVFLESVHWVTSIALAESKHSCRSLFESFLHIYLESNSKPVPDCKGFAFTVAKGAAPVSA